jgi:Eukaryotic aspartyl protease
MAVNENDESELLFGSYDDEKFVGEITWHPVANQLFWSMALDDIKYNGQSLNICGPNS